MSAKFFKVYIYENDVSMTYRKANVIITSVLVN